MWLYVFAIPLIIVMVIGGLAAGGIFTIVFIPLAAIVLGAAVVYLMWGRATDRSNIPGEREPVEPLPHAAPGSGATAPSSPEGLADAQRRQQ